MTVHSGSCFEVHVGDSFITLNSDGSIEIKCKKLNIESSDNVQINSKKIELN